MPFDQILFCGNKNRYLRQMFTEYHIYIVFGVVLFLIVSLFREWMKPALAFFVGVLILLLVDVVKPAEALAGFANKQLAVIVLLLMLSAVFKKSTAIQGFFAYFLKPSDSPRKFLFKMMTSVGLSSAFFNNTPLVAMLMPYVYSWSKKNGISPSKFLIPLSFSSILGGCITVIGTSTILIASGMAESLGQKSLDLFSVTIIGLPMFVVGVVFIGFVGYKLLPSKKDVLSKDVDAQNERQFFFETELKKDSAIVGKCINDAGLRNLEGLFLVELERGGKTLRPVSSNEVLEENDKLFFAGDAKSIQAFHKQYEGLALPVASGIDDKLESVAEIVVSHRSSLSGREVRETNFRNKFDAAILAIHRNGERVWGQLGRVKLKEGDVLLVMKGQDFEARIENSSDFYVISKQEVNKDVDFKKVILMFLGMIGAIALAAFGYVALIKSLLVLLAISVVIGIAESKDLKSAIDYNLILIIGLGLALGQAMSNSGADEVVASSLNSVAQNLGSLGALILVFVVTSVLSAVITPSPTIALILPVAIEMATLNGVADATPFVICVALSAAANFITPIGYQTNLMVYGPGGYNFKDFFKVGFPLTIMYMVVCITILTFTYNI